MDVFLTPKTQKPDELEVTGISRSGRVRKKSSKLLDFESDDLVDAKYRKQKLQQQQIQHRNAQQILARYEQQQKLQGNSFQQASTAQHQKNSESHIGPYSIQVKSEPKTVPLSDTEDRSSESHQDSESEEANGILNEEQMSLDSASDEEVDPLLIDEPQAETGFRKLEPPDNDVPSQANSLYLSEKCRKKLVIKDGRVISRVKARRKDKGKTRFTAYMLWSKGMRHDLLEQNPDMDFSAISKRLGELWSTVPNLEKYNWQRRAKRMATQNAAQLSGKDEVPGTMAPPGIKKKFINKIGKDNKTSPTKKNCSFTITSSALSPPSPSAGKDLVAEPVLGIGMYKVVGTQPIDVAAHLKLLGESLTIIGQRLKEHEGQIAVSGSLPLLLDSLLCALGPLLCLTQQVPEMNGAKPETLSGILENVAYIMPGL